MTDEAAVASAIENAELMIEQSLEEKEKTDDPYELGYHQGRKDACRVILLSFNESYSGPTSEDVL